MNIRWYTKTEYVDTDTGEIITKSRAEREYIINKTTHKTEYNEHKGTKYGIRKFTKECTRNRQQKLEFS